MISKTGVVREAARRVRRQNMRTGDDVRRLREDAGVSIRELGRVTGLHPSFIARIEAAETQASVPVLTRISIALGADLSIRFYAGVGPRLHDRFQAPMIEALLRSLDPRWSARLEVPVGRPSRGVVDLQLDDGTTATTVIGESQSEFRRLEQQIRWFTEKADRVAERLNQDGIQERDVSRLLILRSTESTRDVARHYETTLATAYPARTADVVRALTTPSAPWPGAGIVWMRVEGGAAELLAGPPRGISLGR
jgi:transcriptional regulator with XRE-family HTH domain